MESVRQERNTHTKDIKLPQYLTALDAVVEILPSSRANTGPAITEIF